MNKQELQRVFGFSGFREGQEDVVRSITSGRDVLVLFPTGNGKSLCFQLSGLCLPHLTVVITPLLALMQDQVSTLQKKGISAMSWNSTSSWNEKREVVTKLQAGTLKFLYLSPEKLLSHTVQKLLQHVEISQVVVDEAHCVSQWSPEFRPLYGEISHFVREYSKQQSRPVVSAFTATATRATCQDILRLVGLEEPRIIALPFYRPNLRTQVIPIPSESLKRRLMLRFLQWWKHTLGGSALIYAATRGETEWLAQWLTLSGFPAAAFHAGISNREKQALLDNYLLQERALLVCTSAFGMGVDKPNVRLVLHHTPPTSLEAYTQEAGRAGRDGETAWPILLYSPQDLERNFLFTIQQNQSQARKRFLYAQATSLCQFAESSKCLGKMLFQYFSVPGISPPRSPECHCGNCERFTLE